MTFTKIIILIIATTRIRFKESLTGWMKPMYLYFYISDIIVNCTFNGSKLPQFQIGNDLVMIISKLIVSAEHLGMIWNSIHMYIRVYRKY